MITATLTLGIVGCSSPVNPDQLYSRCTHYLESTFIDKTDSAETQKAVLAKMQLACERAREECRARPDGNNCAQFVRKYQ
ncbi:MAG: hypothetical protein ACC707_07645 [Thiohalomonadales bacterium]